MGLFRVESNSSKSENGLVFNEKNKGVFQKKSISRGIFAKKEAKTAEEMILNDKNRDINDRRAGAEILADFYLEWQEKLDDYRKLSRMPETEENNYYFVEQREEMMKLLAQALVDFDFDDGEGYKGTVRKLAFEMKMPEYSGSDEFFSVACGVLMTHLIELRELKETGMGIFPGGLSIEMAERMIREKAGLDYVEYLEEEETELIAEDEIYEEGIFDENQDGDDENSGFFVIPNQLMV